MPKPAAVVNLAQLRYKQRGDGGKFQFQHARLGDQLGLEKLGLGVFVVPPGHSAFPYHAHSSLDELCIILEGEGCLRQNGVEQPIRSGDVIGAACGVAHQIINRSQQDLRYLVISNQAEVDVVHYPDSDKILAVSGAFEKPLWHITRRADNTDYYAGESDPDPSADQPPG